MKILVVMVCLVYHGKEADAMQIFVYKTLFIELEWTVGRNNMTCYHAQHWH